MKVDLDVMLIPDKYPAAYKNKKILKLFIITSIGMIFITGIFFWLYFNADSIFSSSQEPVPNQAILITNFILAAITVLIIFWTIQVFKGTIDYPVHCKRLYEDGSKIEAQFLEFGKRIRRGFKKDQRTVETFWIKYKFVYNEKEIIKTSKEAAFKMAEVISLKESACVNICYNPITDEVLYVLKK